MSCHRAIAGYGCDLLGGKVYLLSFVYLKQIDSFFHPQVLYILAFAYLLHPLYGYLTKSFGNAKYQHLGISESKSSRHYEANTPPHCQYRQFYHRNCYHQVQRLHWD